MQTQEKTQLDNPYESPHARIIIDPLANADYRGKVYSALAIAIGTVLGSVLAAGLLIHSNFSHFKQLWQANITLLITILATIGFLFGSLVISSPSSFLYLTVNFAVAICLLPLVYLLQGPMLEKHDDENLPFHSPLRAVLIGIACLFAMGVMLTLAYLMFIFAKS